MSARRPSNEVAFYYPGHLWARPDWIKTLLLFFDGVGLLVPEYKTHEPEIFDPALAGPLRDKGLLHYLVADKVVDKNVAKELAKTVGDLIDDGAFDSLASAREDTAFHAISRSRLGYGGDEEIADDLFRRLKARGLAKDSEDGLSIPLHPLVRYLVLTLLAQLLRPQGSRVGLNLYPATDQFKVVRALTEILSLPAMPSIGRIVEFDLNTVSIDLAAVPLDEVLGFRAEHGAEYKAYARAIRQFAREISLLLPDEQASAFLDRQAEIDDLSSDLKRRSRSAWRMPASFALGLAGAYWIYRTGDPVGALLAGGAVAAAGMGERSGEAGAFSYLFSARDEYNHW